jgi:hypothetical protein
MQTDTSVPSRKQRPRKLVTSIGSSKRRALPRYFMSGSDAQREMYARARHLLNFRSYGLRRRLAEEQKAARAFEIARDKGFTILPPGTFAEVDEIVAFAQDVAANAPDSNDTKKAQLRRNFIDPADLHLDSVYVRFALRPDILAAISAYLEMVPVLVDIDVWHSVHHNGEFSNSQLYHCDPEDVSQVKIFLYCNDVTPQSGPLTVVDAANSQRVRDELKYLYRGERQRVSDEDVRRLIKPEDEVAVTGPAGTCAFVDTSRCLHFGSRVEEATSSRILTLFQYTTSFAFAYPLDFRPVAPYKHLAQPSLPQLQQLVLGAV